MIYKVSFLCVVKYIHMKLPFYLLVLIFSIGCSKEETVIEVEQEQTTGADADPINSINETSEVVLAYATPFATSVSLDMPPAKSQGSQLNCSAWATVYYLHSYLKHKAENSVYNLSTLSCPSYTYNQYKNGNCNGGSGALVHLSILKNQGACSLKEMPYNVSQCDLPNEQQKTNAANNKIGQYFKINRHNTNLGKTILNLELPIVTPVAADKALHNLPNSHVWTPDGVSPSGHMVTMCGYNDLGYLFINSWGSNWGNNGKFYIPYNSFSTFPNKEGFIAFWANNPALDNLSLNKESEYLLNTNANNSGVGNNGTLNNVVNSSNRKAIQNTAIAFNGSNSSISINEGFTSKNFSVSLWFNKSDKVSPIQTILSQVNKSNDPNNNIEVYTEKDTLVIDLPLGTGRYKLSSNTVIQPNTWYHLVYTFDGKFLKFYLNGKAVKYAIYMNYFKNNNTGLTLGCSLANINGVKDHFFNGKLDDIKIYSRAIKETEVDKLFLE
jgi:C1A family cysteine protease